MPARWKMARPVAEDRMARRRRLVQVVAESGRVGYYMVDTAPIQRQYRMRALAEEIAADIDTLARLRDARSRP